MRSNDVTAGEAGFTGQYNMLHADARGGSVLHAHQQLGALALGTNPTNGQTLTLTVNSAAIVITFVGSIGTTAGNVLIGASAALTLANLMALLRNPSLTTSAQVGLSAANQQLLSYLSFQLSGTTITPSSNNRTVNAPLTSFTAATTVTSGTWTANTLRLYVEPGVCFINGTEVYFAGGSSPTVTAPSANPRIDVLTLDNSGTLAWTVGSENATPVVPAYPANKIPVCELYNVVGETALYDSSNQASGQGYVYNDVRPYLQGVFNPAALAFDMIPDSDGTRDLGSLSKEFNNIYTKTNIFVNGAAAAISKFGGTGADGALSITSGTTTLSAAGALYFEKNYTSISITGGTLAFSTPHAQGTIIRLRSQGNVTLNESGTAINIASMGGAAGTGTTGVTSSSNAGTFAGGTAGGGGGIILNETIGGSAPGGGGGSGSGFGGNGISTNMFNIGGQYVSIVPFSWGIQPGGGGGGGSGGWSSAVTPGNGGNGGIGAGALIIECAGAYNFAAGTVISGVGANGSAGTTNNAITGGTGGGGGGGNVLVLYVTLTADAGTYTLTGGTGGGGGAAGAAVRAINTYFA